MTFPMTSLMTSLMASLMTSLVTSLLVSLVISQLVPETALVRAPAPLREEMERIAVLLSELKWRDKEGDALDKIRKLAAAARLACWCCAFALPTR
jgi:hypothetical protein